MTFAISLLCAVFAQVSAAGPAPGVASQTVTPHIELAQYRFMSVAALKGMFARYPRGTALTLQRHAAENADVTAAIAEIIAFGASQGLSIKAR